ncbi:MAG: Trk system potassium transporter TrkA [Firmicutes bacterium]|nr:Trk system potassium transporter TrkA [Bacillota bacterium]
MRIVIVGAGKLGYELAKRLSQENRDVVVLDRDPERLREIDRNLDVMAVDGNGCSPRVLDQAGVAEAKLVIAVTRSDEVNMLTCLLAKRAGAQTTVARVRNPGYELDGNGATLGHRLGIDLTVNPEHQAAIEMARLLKTPNASEIDYLAGGRVQLGSFVVDEGSSLVHTPVRDLNITVNTLVAIMRDGEAVIPRGNTSILPGDRLFLVGRPGVLSLVGLRAGKEAGVLRKVCVIGGTEVGYYLARALEPFSAHGVHVKVIEKDHERCRALAVAFPQITVIHADATRLEVLDEEGVGESSAVAVTTDEDQANLLTGYILKRMGVRRVVVSLKQEEYLPFTSRMDLDGTVVPRLIAAGAILKMVRGGHVVSLALLREANAEVVEVVVNEGCRACQQAIKDIALPEGAVIGSVVRNGHVIAPRGDTRIAPGDHVIVFALEPVVSAVEQLFE